MTARSSLACLLVVGMLGLPPSADARVQALSATRPEPCGSPACTAVTCHEPTTCCNAFVLTTCAPGPRGPEVARCGVRAGSAACAPAACAPVAACCGGPPASAGCRIVCLPATACGQGSPRVIADATGRPGPPPDRPRESTFRLVSLDGECLDPEALRGKAVVLNFWFTACRPSCAAIPALNRLADAHRGRDDIAFIGIALDEEDALRDFLADREFRYKIASDPRGTVAGLYGVQAYPAHVVIDRRGRVVGQLYGTMDALDEVLENLVDQALRR